MSVEERWAWAREHHVEPPEYAERPSSEPGSEPPAGKKKPHRSCCSHHSGEDPDATEPCCCEESADPDSPPSVTGTTVKPEAKKPTRGKSVRWALGIAALKCKGLSTLWVTAGVVGLTIEIDVQPVPSVPEWLPAFNESPRSTPLPPLDPPPRTSFA
jgi:hypothetical protein